MNEQQQLEALQTYFAFMSMNGGVRIFHTAQQMGIFKAMKDRPLSAGDLAGACGTKEQQTSLLLEGLCGLGAVQKLEGKYALTPVMQLLAGDYQNLSNRYWDHLPEFLMTGVPMATMDDPSESEKQYQAQVTALSWMMGPSAEVATAMLGMGNTQSDLSILDVGCGAAVWSLACARKNRGAHVTALDWPAVLQIAQKAAEEAGLSDRFTPLPGNYHDLELPESAFDMVIVGNVTHIETPEGNRALFRKLYPTLKQSGRLVVFDVFGDNDKGKLQTALYAIGLALRTKQGQVHSLDNLKSFVEEAGFTGLTASPIDITPYTMGMLVAEK